MINLSAVEGMASATTAGMYAIVRHNTYDPTKFNAGYDQLAKFDDLHAQQPGFRGTITIETGRDSRILVNLWDSQEAAKSGLEQLRPAVQELVQPLLASESILIGEGTVLESGVLAS